MERRTFLALLGINLVGASFAHMPAVAQRPARKAVSVRDYGAGGGGDDTKAIQAAIDSGASEIFVPDGDYNVTKLTIRDKNMLTLRGTGRLFLRGHPVAGTHGLALLGSRNIIIDGITIDGQNEGRGKLAGAHNISIYGCTDVTFKNVRSLYSSSDGFYINRSASGARVNGFDMSDGTTSNISILGCSADYSARQGLSGIAYDGLMIEDCSFSKTGQSAVGNLAPSAGIDLEANQKTLHVPRRTTIRRTKFMNNKGAGVIVNARSVDTLIEDFQIEAGTSFGIFNGGSRTLIRHGVIRSTGARSRPAINNASQADFARASLQIENVDIVGAIQGGVTHSSYADLSIRNVTIRDSANYGLRLLAAKPLRNGGVGFVNVEGLTIKELTANDPPTNSAYVSASGYDGSLSLRRVRLVRNSNVSAIDRALKLPAALRLNQSEISLIGRFAQ